MKNEPVDQREVVEVGHISGVHGVKGWVKIYSLTDPREGIFEYQPWLLGESRKEVHLVQGKKQGKYLIALFDDINDRDKAEGLLNQPIAIYRDQFSTLPEDEFYWSDLLGLSVQLQDGSGLGTIDQMLATGANDVMVVKGERERLIPFVYGLYVKSVNLEDGIVIVDWDPDFE